MIRANKTTTWWLVAAMLPGMAAATESIDARVDRLVAKVKSTLVVMPGGSFDMGDWGDEYGRHWDMEEDSRPLHKVTLDGFSMMAYKVTFDDFDVFTDATGNERIDMDPDDIDERAPRRAAGVSWFGATAYCHWLGKLTNLPFSLPSEAQWEYAARSGGKRVLFGTDNGKLDRPRNFPKLREYGEPPLTLPDVGSFPPNPAGLYGMTENTQEWVQDWYDENYYKISPEKNPMGPATGTKKVRRGSVGGMAEIAAAVFMRLATVPQRLEPTYPNGPGGGVVRIPFPGYSSYSGDNFRCVVAGTLKGR